MIHKLILKIMTIPSPGKNKQPGVKWEGWTDEQYKYYLLGFKDGKRACIKTLKQDK